MENEVTPDKDSTCNRYGHITLGDGLCYRVAMLAFGPRGERMRKAMETLEAFGKKDGGTTINDCYKAAESLLTDSLGVFYSDDVINKIFDNNAFSKEDVPALMLAVLGVDQKKTLTDENSQEPNTE